MSMTYYEEVEACIKAQKELVERYHAPSFAPPTGRCPCCGAQIYGGYGISLDHASKRLVTGCPFCRTSYCD